MKTLTATAGGGSVVPPMHPVAACLTAVQQAFAAVGDAPCWSLSSAELADLTAQAAQVVAAATELRLRLVAAADVADIAVANGATSTAAWLRHSDRLDRNTAAAEVRLASELDRTCEATRRALVAGAVNVDQAHVITRAVTGLPPSVGETDRARVELMLLDHAREFGPDELRRLGRRVFEVIDPDNADYLEGKALEAEEARARQLSQLTMRRTGDGTTRGAFRLPDVQADMLRTWLEAASAPRRRSMADDSDTDPDTAAENDLPYPVGLGRAFGSLCEHLQPDGFSRLGALAATVTINIDYDRLRDQLGAALLSTNTPISAAQARRLACNSGLLPMVLDTDSVVLDLGRSERLHNRYQRIVMGKRDGGCIWRGCDRPPAWCEAHHITPWSEGGETNVRDGCLLCVVHHHLAHSPGWRVVMAADGIPEVIPPARVDPERRPLRHERFKRRRC